MPPQFHRFVAGKTVCRGSKRLHACAGKSFDVPAQPAERFFANGRRALAGTKPDGQDWYLAADCVTFTDGSSYCDEGGKPRYHKPAGENSNALEAAGLLRLDVACACPQHVCTCYWGLPESRWNRQPATPEHLEAQRREQQKRQELQRELLEKARARQLLAFAFGATSLAAPHRELVDDLLGAVAAQRALPTLATVAQAEATTVAQLQDELTLAAARWSLEDTQQRRDVLWKEMNHAHE